MEGGDGDPIKLIFEPKLIVANYSSLPNALLGVRDVRLATPQGASTLGQIVVVRDPITKNSSELRPALRDILDKTEIGHLTAPETTPQGVELFALCAKKETKDTPEKAQAREKLFAEQFETPGMLIDRLSIMSLRLFHTSRAGMSERSASAAGER